MERFDFNYAPYDQLSAAERLTLQKNVDIVFYNDGDTILEPQQDIAHLYVVIKGIVCETAADGEIIALYREKDSFEARALMEGKSQHQFTVQEQALLYRLPRAALMDIMAANPRFGAYFYAGVAEKLAQLSQSGQEQEMASLFSATIREAYRPNTVFLPENSTLGEAALHMKQQKSKSALLRHHGQTGLFTESAFRDILLAGGRAEDPVHPWATFDLISVDMDDFIFNALLHMTRHHIQRVVVLDHGDPIGTLEQLDVLAYFSNHSHLIAQRLEIASTIADLAVIAAHMTDTIRILHTNGMRAPQLAELISVLNTTLFEKAWRIIAPQELYENTCLIVMGSEGRGEQILKTDQDNGLILSETIQDSDARPYAEQFSQALTELGYPPCPGGIMVNNPKWTQNLSGYQHMIRNWLKTPTPDAMMNLAIFSDAKAIAGDPSLLAQLKHHLRDHIGRDSAMSITFARAIDLFDGQHRGLIAQLIGREDAQMDIKKIGIFPIVHGARALALDARLDELNTFDRLQALKRKRLISAELAQDSAEALGYLMELRLKAGLNPLAPTHTTTLNPETLSTLERDLLKDALHVVKRFKHKIRQHYHLGGH